jgi:hypothetical protein
MHREKWLGIRTTTRFRPFSDPARRRAGFIGSHVLDEQQAPTAFEDAAKLLDRQLLHL